jgi:hypothetical protein
MNPFGFDVTACRGGALGVVYPSFPALCVLQWLVFWLVGLGFVPVDCGDRPHHDFIELGQRDAQFSRWRTTDCQVGRQVSRLLSDPGLPHELRGVWFVVGKRFFVLSDLRFCLDVGFDVCGHGSSSLLSPRWWKGTRCLHDLRLFQAFDC